MILQLMFNDLESDLFNAIALVRINDTSECDAPAIILSSGQSEPFDVSLAEPSIRIDVDIDRPAAAGDLSVAISVKGTCKACESAHFINTSMTPLPDKGDDILITSLEKI